MLEWLEEGWILEDDSVAFLDDEIGGFDIRLSLTA
jgi:hypothetical protein